MRRTLAIAVFLILLAVGGACEKKTTTTTTQASPSVAPSASPTITDTTLPKMILPIGETSTTAQVEVAVSQPFALALSANQSTGFQWNVTLTPDVLSALGSSYNPTATPVIPGSGGIQYLSFQGQRPGTGTIALAYQRPGSNEAAARTVSVSVTVVASVTSTASPGM